MLTSECRIEWDRPGTPGDLARQRYTYDADGNLAQTWVTGDTLFLLSAFDGNLYWCRLGLAGKTAGAVSKPGATAK